MRFKGAPLIAPTAATSNTSFHIFFAIFRASESGILGESLSVTWSASSSSHFTELFCEFFYTNKRTTMCIFKCNSIVISSTPLILTSDIGMPSEEPSGASSTALACSYLSVPRFLFIVHLQLFSKRTLRRLFKSNIKSTVKCNF